MKSIFQLITLLCLSVMASMMESCSTKNEKIVLAYVTSHGATLPDPDLVTHINYAFAHVDSTFSKLKIDNEGRLSEITALKQKAPHLKVLLSVGGWESGRFSEMAANEQYRLSFANDCRRAIEQFQLDGIDIDWEYPTSSAAGISSSPDDTQNYTLLMRDLRKAIGPEVIDAQLLDFPAETLPVMVTHRTFAGEKVSTVRAQKFMHGVSIRSIKRAGINIPVLAQTVIDSGDILELTGTKFEVETAAKQMGYIDRPTNQTDMIFVGLGILIGGLVGALAIHLGGIPISLSTSGGALIAGLVFGWLRSKRPTFGGIPEPSLWVLNNVGLNMFIAVVGIAAGPSFVTGFKEVGFSLFIVGALATAIPLLSGLLMGRYLFKFHPALTLGCTAGARTTTAALGAIQDALGSDTPALGYTVTYAVGNTLLIIWGVAIVLLM